MKRAIIAGVSFAAAVIICFAGYFILSRTCRSLMPPLKEITACAQKDDADGAARKADEMLKLWDNAHGKIEALTRHQEVDELEEIIKSLPVLARQGNMGRLEELSESAYDRLEHIRSKEIPLFSNIF